jgi:hypothetical protein
MHAVRCIANCSIKQLSIRGLSFFEKAPSNKFRHDSGYFWGPLPDALVENPPTEDTLHCILGFRLSPKVVENLRCGRWK